ncbi:MAG: sigma-70 family RNA polymerase sigma factor [Acidobacteriales bacterium]|nr:sigma-70 family RNA polymerase sigma factor [Terriglobales bacterium]
MEEAEATELINDLYGVLYSPLLRYTAHMTGRLELAEDIVQEAFTRLYRDLRRGHRIDNPRAWAFAVVRREVGRHWKKAEIWGILEPLERAEKVADGSLTALDSLMKDEVSILLSALSPREAEVVLLRLGSLKYREIGAELGMGVKSVGTLLARALKKLRRVLADGPENLSFKRHVQKSLSKESRRTTLQ